MRLPGHWVSAFPSLSSTAPFRGWPNWKRHRQPTAICSCRAPEVENTTTHGRLAPVPVLPTTDPSTRGKRRPYSPSRTGMLSVAPVHPAAGPTRRTQRETGRPRSMVSSGLRRRPPTYGGRHTAPFPHFCAQIDSSFLVTGPDDGDPMCGL